MVVAKPNGMTITTQASFEPCCERFAVYGDHGGSCQVYLDLPDCPCCGEKIEHESREFKMPGHTEGEERHPTCCPSVVYVNAYAETLAYGGGEEGGWWYSVGEPLGSIPIDVNTDPSAFIEHYKLLFKDVQIRRKSSMGGQDLVIRVEEHQAEFYPDHKPHYE